METFCAVICEYNPFHNGHARQLEKIRAESGCDRILCLMSGNFTQRGEAAVFDKYARARHAVLCGADVVLELPVAFSVAPAELFAKGAVKLLASLPDVRVLAFGCESGGKTEFLSAAQATLSEDKQFKATLKENLKSGDSFARARTKTLLALNEGLDESLFSSPNNVLGVEYCRAILSYGSAISPLPLKRVGSGHADGRVRRNFSSATALRACMAQPSIKTRRALKRNLPAPVLPDALAFTPFAFETAVMCALAAADPRSLALVTDCTEGLENRLKALQKSNPDYRTFLSKATSKRYTLSRLKRILCANLLGVRDRDVRDFLASPLYYKVLAVKKSGAEEIFSSLGRGEYPLVARKSDVAALKKDARNCFDCDVRANDVYNALRRSFCSEFTTLFVE